MENAENIQELLLTLTKSRPFINSGQTVLYNIPGFDDYFLRVQGFGKNLEDRLKATSTLTPVYLCNHNVGQALLDLNNGLQIIAKVPGRSLSKIYDDAYEKAFKETHHKKDASFAAEKHLLEFLIKQPIASFAQLANSLNKLTRLGITVDIHKGNILWDKKAGFNWVDVFTHQNDPQRFCECNGVEEFLAGLDGSKYVKSSSFANSQRNEINRLRETLRTKIQTATNSVGGIKNEAELADMLDQNTIVLKHAKTIEHIGTLSIYDTPHALRQKLDQIQQYANRQER